MVLSQDLHNNDLDDVPTDSHDHVVGDHDVVKVLMLTVWMLLEMMKTIITVGTSWQLAVLSEQADTFESRLFTDSP